MIKTNTITMYCGGYENCRSKGITTIAQGPGGKKWK